MFETAQNTLLASNDLTIADIEQLCTQTTADFADVFLQYTEAESWSLEGGIVKGGAYDIEHGLGVRTFQNELVGHAYADTINKTALQQALKRADSISRFGQQGSVALATAGEPITPQYMSDNPFKQFSAADKIQLLREMDAYIRQQDSRIQQVMLSLSASHDTTLVMGSDGTLASDIRPLVRLNIQVIVAEGERLEQGYTGLGGRYDYGHLFTPEVWQFHAKEAVRAALVNLDAVPAPAGCMDVVLGPGWPGVLLHEAVGHGLEGDFNRKGTSAFARLMGEQVASPLCTIVDNGAMPQRRGSLSVDDEGTPTQCTTLIEQGKLVGYMQDKHNAHLMGAQSTGNGRRESYAHLPMPRMTNTYMLPGEHDAAEIIASVDKGLYAVNFSGGQVDITSGKFVFVVSEGYLIEKGRVTQPVKGATLIGDGPSALQRVTMVGNDLTLDHGVGICGKDGQSVPVGVGQPTLRINEVTVGGTS